MRSILSSLLAFSALLVATVLAQVDISTLPACLVECMVNATVGACSYTDAKCLCQSQSFLLSSTTCVVSKCNGDDITKSLQDAAGLCADAGAPLTAQQMAAAAALASPKIASDKAAATGSPNSAAHLTSRESTLVVSTAGVLLAAVLSLLF
ncbi:hypothetical protein DL96DRAFT_1617557 [Flagelloscypha sp. PMI_526]|nr:hypothetical protein DL96DRAFT_1617557 [Flagelloscypha sp. PMI_526]